MPALDVLSPEDLNEAVRLLGQLGEQALPLAGGTDLLPALKRGLVRPRVLLDLSRLAPLRGIWQGPDGSLHIGALAILADVASHPLVRERYAALAEAASQVATPEIRNAATLGGNALLDTRCAFYNQSELWRAAVGYCMKTHPGAPCRVAPRSPRCLAVCSSDTAPALVALDAAYRLVGPEGERWVRAADFYRDDGARPHRRKPQELLVEVVLPPAAGLHSVYLKLRRRGTFDFPLLGVAVAVAVDAEGVLRLARMVLGGVSSAPVVVEGARRLEGLQACSPGLQAAVEAVAAEAWARAKPVENADLDALYRKRMTRVLARRALQQGLERALGTTAGTGG